MSRILRVDQNNYRLAVNAGGTITFDTGNIAGTVVITGNLDIRGTTTTVSSTNTTLVDNILQLNFGNTGSGISGTLGYQAGIQIIRGSLPDAYLVYDEGVNHWDSTGSVAGAFVLKTNNGTADGTTGLQVSSLGPLSGNNLYLDMQGSTGVLRVVNSVGNNYSARVQDDNDIPNRKFVTDWVTGQLSAVGVEKIAKTLLSIEQSRVLTTLTGIETSTINAGNLVIRTLVTSAGLTINTTAGAPGVNILGTTITNAGSGNLIITSTNNVVEVNGSLELDVVLSDPAAASNKVKFYSKSTEGPGRTGIYFVSNNAYGSLAYNQDELISKNRAVLLSILL